MDTMKLCFLLPLSIVALVHWKVDYAHAFLAPRSVLFVVANQHKPHASIHYTNNKKPLAAAPDVTVASASDLREALQNPATTVVDARSLEELQATGIFCNDGQCKWIHAPASKVNAPLLELAATALLPDLDAPVVIYCALGYRAASSKRVLEEMGYSNVLNAGGLDDIMKCAPQ
jgi:phage shock protein E